MKRPAQRLALACALAAALVGVGVVSGGAQTGSRLQQGEESVQHRLYCRDLEQQLARDWQAGAQGQELLPQIEAEIRKYDRVYQKSQAKAEQLDCYDYFFFSKTLRNTPQCVRLQQQIEESRARLAELEQQRQSASSSYDRGVRQNALIEELARQGCGPQYEQEARRRANQGFTFWDEQEGADPGLQPYPNQVLPYATYRTICVRLCDGYYFPISFATLPTAFEKDAAVCTAQCAAPAELYVYQNPGEQVESAVSLSGQPYSGLQTAWSYRKKLTPGCSCKVAEYDPSGKGGTAGQQGAVEPATSSTTSVDWGSKVEEPTGGSAGGADDGAVSDDQIEALLDRTGQAAKSGSDPQ